MSFSESLKRLKAKLGRELSDADLDALGKLWADHPAEEPVEMRTAVILTWPCGTKLALTPEELESWERQSAEARRAKPAAAKGKRGQGGDLFAGRVG